MSDTARSSLRTRRDTLLAAGLGGTALITVALPLLVAATVWPGDFDGNTLSSAGRVARAGIAVGLPVAVAAGTAAWLRADVRVSTLLVAVPQAAVFGLVLLWFLLKRA